MYKKLLTKKEKKAFADLAKAARRVEELRQKRKEQARPVKTESESLTRRESEVQHDA